MACRAFLPDSARHTEDIDVAIAMDLDAGLLYTARTHAVSQQQYIGSVTMSFEFVEEPPRAMLWKLVVKNVGSMPEFLKSMRMPGR